MKILADQEIPFVQKYFGTHGELLLKPGRLIKREDLVDVDLLLVRSVTTVNESLLQGTAVKFVGTVTTGIDHLDTQWLEQVGIRWRAASGYNAPAVSDYVIAVLAALYRQQGQQPFAGLRAGVVGLGQVGSRVAQRLKDLGFSVLCCDPPRALQEKSFVSTPLEAFRDLDLVSLHTPLTRKGSYPTYHRINSSFLSGKALPKILINSSRGAVVDFSALPAASKSWTYCFDVWENEPELDLASLASAFIATPHMAGYSVQGRYRGIDMIYRAACEEQIISAQGEALAPLPQQTLAFGGRQMSWQEVVLAIFNPLQLTQAMKALLLKQPEKCATLFDSFRQQHIGEQITRHEFAYTTVTQLELAESDRRLLTQLGITIKE